MPWDQIVQDQCRQISGAGPGRSDLTAQRVARLWENASILTCFAENFFVILLATSQTGTKTNKQASQMAKFRTHTHEQCAMVLWGFLRVYSSQNLRALITALCFLLFFSLFFPTNKEKGRPPNPKWGPTKKGGETPWTTGRRNPQTTREEEGREGEGRPPNQEGGRRWDKPKTKEGRRPNQEGEWETLQQKGRREIASMKGRETAETKTENQEREVKTAQPERERGGGSLPPSLPPLPLPRGRDFSVVSAFFGPFQK